MLQLRQTRSRPTVFSVFCRRQNPLVFSPPDVGDESGEGFLPGVHLDDPNPGHHLVHGADPAVRQHRRLAPEDRKPFKVGFNTANEAQEKFGGKLFKGFFFS